MMARSPLVRAPVAAALALLCLSPSLAAQEAAPSALPATAVIRGENIWLRADPAASSEVLSLMQRGESVVITGESLTVGDARFYPIEVSATGDSGWVQVLFVDPDSIVSLGGLADVAAPPDVETLDAEALPVPVEATVVDAEAMTVPADAAPVPPPDAGDGNPDAAPAPEPTALPQVDAPSIEEPTPASAAGTAPTEPLAVVNSAGLGLTQEQFNEIHGSPEPFYPLGSTFLQDGGLLLTFQNDDLPIKAIEREFTPPVSIDVAREESRALMPEDAVFQETIITSLGVVVDLYTSESLLALLPDPDDWPGAEPGQISVGYFDYNPDAGVTEVARWLMTTGNDRPR